MWLRVTGLLTLLASLTLSAGCGIGGGREANPEALTGKVTANGQPVKSVTLTVTGPDGKTAGGTTSEAGTYTIPNPPKGALKFQFVAPAGKATFPVKYTKPGNDLAFEYTGGKQTYDIDLKP
jgi:hypothetical protein